MLALVMRYPFLTDGLYADAEAMVMLALVMGYPFITDGLDADAKAVVLLSLFTNTLE